MAFLRSVSTRRLLALIAASVVVAGGGAAIAVAATSGGPVPKRESLAHVLHRALSAHAVTGITARISFTDNLIASSDLGQVSSPLLSGATGRLWLSTNHRLMRLELQGSDGDAQVVLDGSSFWVYDPSSNTVYRGQLPSGSTAKTAASAHATKKSDAVPTIAKIQSMIKGLSKHLDLSGATPGDVGGQPTYSVRVSPLHSRALLRAASVAVDAARGVPLRFSLYAKGERSPVLELSATSISFGPVAASAFALSPPAGAKVVDITGSNAASANARTGHGARAAAVTGPAAVAKRLPFALASPAKLAGRARSAVRLLDWSGQPAALLTYGQGLDGIAVIEHAAPAGATSSSGDAGHSELSLPTVTIDGVTADELPTPLGTIISFTRSGVEYTVLGSVAPGTAQAAARGL